MAAEKLPLHLACRYVVIRSIKATKESRIDLGYDFSSREKVIIARFKKRYFHISIQRLRELKNLEHLNLVKIRSASHVNSWIIIVMDYICGKRLSEILNERRVLEKKNLKKWCEEIKAVIEFLHNMKPVGFLHGDIKAENIIIDHCNKAVLIDFSCFKEDLKMVYKDMRTTIAYASEDVLNFGVYDANSDWYSYKMLEDRCQKKT